MALKKIEVSKVGANIEVLVINPGKPNTGECYALTGIKSVVPVYTENIGTSISDRSPYPHVDLFAITINFHNESNSPSIRFDLAEVSNQPGWTADLAGLAQAKLDICGWMTAVAPGGGAPSATEATLQAVLTAVRNHQDFELKLVKDTGNGDKIVCELTEYDETTDTYSYSYQDVGGVAYVVVGPLEYLSTEAVLNLVLAELVSLNAGGQLSTEATLLATNILLTTIDTVLDNILTDTNTLATPVASLGMSIDRKTDATGSPIAAGKRRISIMNVGAADGDILGGTNNIKPGESLTFSADGLRDTLGAFAYDGTGTELVITTVG